MMTKYDFETLLKTDDIEADFLELLKMVREKDYKNEKYRYGKKLAKLRWRVIAKPLGSLGHFEEDVVKLAALTGTPNVDISNRILLVFCSDNGIVEEGVTQTGSDVTTSVATNIGKGRSCSHLMAEVSRTKVIPVDIGMIKDADVGEVNKLVRCKIRRGTRNFLKEAAMTRTEFMKAIMLGFLFVEGIKENGYHSIALGEMGIGNTTTSAAVTSVLLGVDSDLVTGRGAGLSNAGLEHKKWVIKEGIRLRQPDPEDPIDVVSKLGGYDIAAMIGVYLGGAYFDVPIVMDGFITLAAALAAYKLVPETERCMFASHVTREPACRMITEKLGLVAPLNAGMALGEGTGAMTLYPIWDMTLNVYNRMITFEQMDIEAYKPL